MSVFRLTAAAKGDLRQIGRCTRERWGREQARRYLTELDACFHRVAEKQDLGRAYVELPPYRRIVSGRHAIFCRVLSESQVLVVRVLHVQMLPELHLPGDDA